MACPHNRVQDYTERCLDCGANIYETPAERVRRLRAQVASLRAVALEQEGDALEAERDRLLGIDPTDPRDER